MKRIVSKRLGVALCAFMAMAGLSGSALAKGDPIMMLIQVNGPVEFSKDGAQWNKVTQNKMLFEGTQVRSGEGGSGKLVNQVSGAEQELGANTIIKISATGAEVVSGKGLSEGKPGDGGLMSDVKNRFAKAERYTTVRRSVDKEAKAEKVDVAKEITLSAGYPDLVWEGRGQNTSYELVIDGKKIPVPAATGPIVRHKVAGLTPGQHKYHVILHGPDNAVSKEESPGTLTWMSPAEEDALKKEIAVTESKYPGNLFALGSLMEKRGLTVAAMDNFQQYLARSGDDNDFRPFLIKTLQDLKLNELKKAEAQKYNSQAGKP
ncbi:MAG: hypothetical protein HQL66_02295 [Magnetococcales bacterium]|nr:hypothetical protein [Magnetococcales bacterium]